MAGTTTIFDKDGKPIRDEGSPITNGQPAVPPSFVEGPVDPDFGRPPPPDFIGGPPQPDNELPGLGGRPGLQPPEPDQGLPGGPKPDNELPKPELPVKPEPPIVRPPEPPVEPPVEPPTQPVEVYDEVGKASIAFQEAERDKQLELQQLKRDQEAAAKKALDDGFHQAQALPPEEPVEPTPVKPSAAKV